MHVQIEMLVQYFIDLFFACVLPIPYRLGYSLNIVNQKDNNLNAKGKK